MTSGAHLAEISNLIQLAIAPVFLLTSIGTIINVLASRLSRVVDRIRVLEERPPAATEGELEGLDRRLRLTYFAIALAVVSALCVGALITIAFVSAFLAVDLSPLIGLLFIAALTSLIGALLTFLREIVHAISATGARTRRRKA